MANVHIQPMDDGLLNALPTQQDTKKSPNLDRNLQGVEEDKPSQAPKRKTDREVFTRQEETETKKAKTEGELFPNIEQKPLPEKAEEAVNFNSNFLHKKAEKQQETSKPTLAQPDWNPGEVKGAPGDKIALASHRDQPQTEAKVEQSQAHSWKRDKPSNYQRNKDEPLIDFNHRINTAPEEYTDFEKKILGTASGIPLLVANTIAQHRMDEQIDSLEAFRASTLKTRTIQAKRREVLEEMTKNTELERWWTSLKDTASYLSAGASLAFSVGSAYASGGLTPLIGGLGSMGALYLQKNDYDPKLVMTLSAACALFSGHKSGLLNALDLGSLFSFEGLKQVGGPIMTHAVPQLQQGISNYQITKTQEKGYAMHKELNEYKLQQDKERSKKTKKLGTLKSSNFVDTLKAAAHSQGQRTRLLEEIARMLSAA